MKPGAKKGMLLIRYDEKKETTREKVTHNKKLAKGECIEDQDIVDSILEKLMAKKSFTKPGPSGQKSLGDIVRKRPASELDPPTNVKAEQTTPKARASSASAKEAPLTKQPSAQERVRATNDAVKNAYGKLTSEKVGLTKEKARLVDCDNHSRMNVATQQDIDEIIILLTENEGELLAMTSTKNKAEHVQANVQKLYKIAELLKDAKDLAARAKKVKT